MSTEIIKVPDLGDSSDVEVIELLVSVGQKVAENDSLLVLESDKAAMEIPAPMGGEVKSIAVNLGDQVQTGSEILTLEIENSESSPQETEAAAVTDQKPAEPEQTDHPPVSEKESKPTASAGDSAPSGGSVITIPVPDIGGEDDVEVIEIHVAPGDNIDVDTALITLESDKAAMDVPSPDAGEVKALKLKVGDKVSMGTPILELSVTGSTSAPAIVEDSSKSTPASEIPKESVAAPSAPALDSATQPTVAAHAPAQTSNTTDVYAGPAVRKLARELGVDLAQVAGTGAKGRILKENVHEYVKSHIQGTSTSTGQLVSAVPDIDFSQFGDVEKIERTRLQKLTAVNMHRNWSSVPHVAQFNEADVTDLEEFRAGQKSVAEQRNSKLTLLPFLLKACAKALAEYPQFNVSLHSTGEFLMQKKYIHIGIAVATEAGLVVPVIRDVDNKSIWQLTDELVEITQKARDRKLSKQDMQGACFTISSLGAIGGTGFIPIINSPEVAILGVGKTEVKPVFKNGEFVPRKILPLTLSYDHRALNGVDGGMFSTYLVQVLADIRLLLL